MAYNINAEYAHYGLSDFGTDTAYCCFFGLRSSHGSAIRERVARGRL